MSDYIGFNGFLDLNPIISPDKPSFSADQAAAQIARAGVKWGGSGNGVAANVTYSFAGSAIGAWGENTFARFNADQMRSAEMALDAWGDVANIKFSRVGSGYEGNGAYSNSAQIKLEGFTYSGTGASGMSQLPGKGSVVTAVFTGGQQDRSSWIPDGFNASSGYETLMHELGHGLGLSHPTDYKSPNVQYDRDASYAQDTKFYSVMSYFDGARPGHDLGSWTTSATPGIHDIAAIQRIYGANMTTRRGDTVYGFNSNADESYFRITDAFGSHVRFTIWDAGGNDTLDFSGYGFNHVIDLRPGALSSVSNMDPQFGNQPEGYNVGIAFGTVIENAIGGSGGEMIIGNDAANRIDARDGHDFAYGGSGSDVVFGGSGNDHLYGGDQSKPQEDSEDEIWGGEGHDYIQGNAGNDTINGDAGNDRIQGAADNDLIFGGEGYDALNGNKGDDRVYGGYGRDTVQGGQGNDLVHGDYDDDVVIGGYGNDTLAGNYGIDTMTGSLDADVFSFVRGDAGIDYAGRRTDVITDFTSEERIDLDWTVSKVVQGGSFGSLDEAVNHARTLNDAYAVDAVKVGNDTFLFWNVYGGNSEAVRLDGVDPSSIDLGDFI